MRDGLTKAQRVDGVLVGIMNGQPLRLAIGEFFGDTKTFFDAISGDRELGSRYARAMEMRADLLVDDTIELADGNGDPAKVRNQIQVRQWTAGKHNSKRYGERIDLNVQQAISVDVALTEARQRILRPVRDQLEVTDVQSLDISGLGLPRPTDKQSPDPIPDIFS